MKTAVLYTKIPPDKCGCTACTWMCKISNNEVGVCGSRLNIDGKLYSLVYGKTTGLAVDPVEKKPLHHFLPGSKILSFGTAGCNFGCKFCQNSWMSQSNKFQIPNTKNQNYLLKIKNIQDNINKISIDITPKKIVKQALENGCQGIAYTYNEPAIFVEFAHDTAKLAHKAGLKNIFVSNGYESNETYDYMNPYLDAINIDLKSFSNDFYLKICQAKIGPVKENIRRFYTGGIETEVTTLIIPGKNDTSGEIKSIAEFICSISLDIPWHISAFHPEYKMKDISETPREKLNQAFEIGKSVGLKYVYIGNISDSKRSSTYCSGCSEILVRRNWYEIEILNINFDKGACRKCGEKIYGVWN
jgi:pyruvate formate lyase activating enzyme